MIWILELNFFFIILILIGIRLNYVSGQGLHNDDCFFFPVAGGVLDQTCFQVYDNVTTYLICNAPQNPPGTYGRCVCLRGNFEVEEDEGPLKGKICKPNDLGGQELNKKCYQIDDEESQFDYDNPRYLKHCVAELNLVCSTENICLCKPGHVKSPTPHPAYNVDWCIPGNGTKKRGEACLSFEDSEYINERCNDGDFLVCKNGVCVCEDGYTVNGNNCEKGQQTFEMSCDEPDLLYPPQEIDPNTGVTYPGPIAPPPPRIACEPYKNLRCMDSKCVCRGDRNSKKYEQSFRTGGCLLTGGYECARNAECISNICSEPPETMFGSHTHTHKVCCCVYSQAGLHLLQSTPGLFFIVFHIHLLHLLVF